MSLGIRQVLVAVVGALLVAGPAAADDSARNKEGFWTVGRGEATSDNCMASMTTQSGEILMLRAAAGEVGFAVGANGPMRRGSKAKITTGAYSFDFAPVFNDKRDLLYLDGVMDDRALAALKLARDVAVSVEGRTVLSADLEHTGFENALEALVACSNGKSGWWGPGVEVQPAAATKEDNPSKERPLHKDGIWTLAADGDGCVASVELKGGGGVVFIATSGGRDVTVGAGGGGSSFKRGRKGRFETDTHGFDFKPLYEGDGYLQLDTFLDGRALFALRHAKFLRITVDGREQVWVELEGTGLPDVVTSLESCARGEKGWWGEGAALP